MKNSSRLSRGPMSEFESRVDSMLIAPDVIDPVKADVLTPEEFAAVVRQVTKEALNNRDIARINTEKARRFSRMIADSALFAEQITSQYRWDELEEPLTELLFDLQDQLPIKR